MKYSSVHQKTQKATVLTIVPRHSMTLSFITESICFVKCFGGLSFPALQTTNSFSVFLFSS